MLQQKITDGVHRGRQRLVFRVAVIARGDQRKGDGCAAVFFRQRQCGPVAGDEPGLLAVLPAMPARADGVDDISARQTAAGRDPGLALGAAVQRAARRGQLRPGGAENGAADAAVPEQRRVGGADDGVHVHFGDVISHDLQRHGGPAFLFFWL